MAWSNPVVSLAQTAALAIDIAEAITASGVPLVGAPTPVYNLPSAALAGAGPVGATVWPQGYGFAGSDYIDAASKFDGYCGNLPIALTMQKWYLPPGTYILSAGQIPAGLLALINAGCRILLSIKPSQALTLSDYANVLTTINVLKAAGASNLLVTLWNEPNQTGVFPSAAAYIAFVNYYIGAVRAAGVPHAYTPSVFTNATSYTYYPGDANVDYVLPDYYGDAFKHGSLLDSPIGGAAGSLMSLADNHLPSPIPFGLGEWGDSATGVPLPETGPTGWIAYWNYLLNLFATRLNHGKTNGPILYFSGQNPAGPDILPDGSGGYDLTVGISTLYNGLSAAATTVTIGAGATLTTPPLNPSPSAGYAPLNGLSYEISASLTASASSTVPFAAVLISFYDFDVPGGRPIEQVQWFVPMGAAGTTGSVITGKGPQRGAYMQIQVTNLDTQPVTLQLQLNSTGRSAAGDDWEWDAHGAAMPLAATYTPCGGPSFANSLGTIGGGTPVTVAAGASTTRILSMYSGQVYLRWGVTATTPADCSLTITPLPQSQWGSATLYNVSGGDNTYITLPRCPCLVTLTNSQSTGTATFFANFMTQRMAQ
jgi:hypothetical protein